MKKTDIDISFAMRQIIKNDDIRNMIYRLYEHRNEKGSINISLPLAHELLNKIAEDPDHEGMDNFNAICPTLDDWVFLMELVKLHVINLTESTIDDNFSTGVVIRDQEIIERLNTWVKDENLIVNYGIFSLHTFTGEAYCLDNKYIFHTNKGLFRVFQAFLKEPNHILSYEKIYNTFHESEKLKYRSEQIHQIIAEIREKLQMKDKLSKLFMPSGDKYILKSP